MLSHYIPQKLGERTGLCFVTGTHAYHNLALLGTLQNTTEADDVANRFYAGLPLEARAPRCAVVQGEGVPQRYCQPRPPDTQGT